MVWASIPKEKLQHISLFGYDLIGRKGKCNIYDTPQGIVYVDRERPNIHFEDISDAIQLEAKGILTPKDESTDKKK